MENKLPEAPTSVTLSIITPKGYNALFTMRDEKALSLVEKIKTIEEYFTANGYKPQPARTFGGGQKKEIEYLDEKCPEDGARVIKGNGKIEKQCENYKYDFATKTNVGKCKYILWA